MMSDNVAPKHTDNDQPADSRLPLVVGASGAHIAWSPWTQKRLLRIGVPLAGLLLICAPSIFLAKSISSNISAADVADGPLNSVTLRQALDSSQPQQSSNLTVNGKAVPLPQNSTVEIIINDVYSTTHISAQSTSSQTTHDSATSNTSESTLTAYQTTRL